MQEFFDKAEPRGRTSAATSQHPRRSACVCNQSPDIKHTA